jgi:trehalose 6-phosphate phosphatase
MFVAVRHVSCKQGGVAIPAAEPSVPVFAAPPPSLSHAASLFLDLDGTLVHLIDRPEEVRSDPELNDLLVSVGQALDGRLAIVSGRSLAQIDLIFGPVAEALVLSGSHGCEFRMNGEVHSPDRDKSLDNATERFRKFADSSPFILLEEKSFGVALHYRMLPEIEPEARKLATQLAQELGLYVQIGKMMVELRPYGYSKGDAIRRLIAEPAMAGHDPVFVGDDITDEDGFKAAVALGGHGILVGAPRTSAALYTLPDIAAVRNWLRELIR